MPSKKITFIAFVLSILTIAVFVSCNNDDGDSGPQPSGEEKTFELNAVGSSGVSGTALFEKLDDLSVRITLSLTGTTSGGDHPTHIHSNSAAEGGGIAIDLTNVDGSTGISQTILTALNDGSAMTYEALLAFDGYINVHAATDNLGSLLAQGDIGTNVLTGETEEYTLSEVGESGISGTATFSERISGETLVVLDLTGDPTDSDHPTHIHTGSTSNPGGIAIDLSNVKDGFSRTNVSAFNDGNPVTYEELIDYAGYINVHNAEGDLGTLVSQGDIGSSVGSGSATNYNVSNSGASSYVFNGNGLTNSSNPNITLQKGKTYTFTVNTAGHPFWINSVQGTGQGNAYSSGVSNNGSDTGTITFMVPNDAPAKLFYNCEFHSPMTGEINISD